MENEEQEKHHMGFSQTEQVDSDHAFALALQQQEREFTLLETIESDADGEEDEVESSSSGNLFVSLDFEELEFLDGEASNNDEMEEDDIDPDELSYEELIALGEIIGEETRGLSAEEISSSFCPYVCRFAECKTTIDRCVVCQVEYEEGETVVALQCGHPFHAGCIDKWLQIKKVCPICYTEVLPSGKGKSQIHSKATCLSPPVLKQHCNFSRRELTISINSCLLLLLGSQTLDPHCPPKAHAEENLIDPDQKEKIPNNTPSCSGVPTKRAFLDISINEEPIGRIIIGLYEDNAPLGTSRFRDHLSGKAGVSYKRKAFTKIMPNYVQHGGVRSYGADVELVRRTGTDLGKYNLVEEWERVHEGCRETKNLAGSVSIIVRDPSKPLPKQKLVARKGKLEIDQEEEGMEPNGTEFVIATKDSPELDASALVVGRVLQGMDVVQRIGQVKTVQENSSSPYFRVAKLIGDKRALVAERGFNRPYSKVIVTNCGLLE
ncbi:hypothetical protein Nepgr_023725 [Nepenthes gracilis]|uniref:Peptidylprolyl isomerase n=1 Tax=Nepenthes gracilis TaxID=150966 RepID=A0AAD3XXY8_NEPGR|nr:hypothetical protein Nepgr_023725 [Nepenthes gracilis]